MSAHFSRIGVKKSVGTYSLETNCLRYLKEPQQVPKKEKTGIGRKRPTSVRSSAPSLPVWALSWRP